MIDCTNEEKLQRNPKAYLMEKFVYGQIPWYVIQIKEEMLRISKATG